MSDFTFTTKHVDGSTTVQHFTRWIDREEMKYRRGIWTTDEIESLRDYHCPDCGSHEHLDHTN